MRAKVLLGCSALLVVAVLQTDGSAVAQGASQTVNVDVRIDCLGARGASFSVIPWAVYINRGDSVNWKLDQGANVTEMQIVPKSGKPWPFVRKTAYRVLKTQPSGARALDNAEKGNRYKYDVRAICLRDQTVSDTLIIDPDLIIR